MATEGRILTAVDVSGGNPVRTVVQSTQANDEGAVSNKDTQVFVQGDPNTPANLSAIDSVGRLHVNIAGSGGLNAGQAGALTAASASATTATAGTSTSGIIVDVSSAGNASFHLLATAFVGTVVFEQSFDPAGSAASWALVPCVPEDATSAPANTLPINTAVAYVRQFTQTMFGPTLFRIRCSVFTSGSLGVILRAGAGWYESQPALAPSNVNAGGMGPWQSAPVTTNFTPTAASAQMLAANVNRRGYTINNDSNVDVIINRSGGTVSTTGYGLRIPSGGYYESPAGYVSTSAFLVAGIVGTTLTAAGTGALRIEEY